MQGIENKSRLAQPAPAQIDKVPLCRALNAHAGADLLEVGRPALIRLSDTASEPEIILIKSHS